MEKGKGQPTPPQLYFVVLNQGHFYNSQGLKKTFSFKLELDYFQADGSRVFINVFNLKIACTAHRI